MGFSIFHLVIKQTRCYRAGNPGHPNSQGELMFRAIDTKDAGAVRGEVSAIYTSLFPEGDPRFLGQAFQWVSGAFAGNYRGYQAIDTKYHDLRHTLEVTLCFARLLEGYHLAGAIPALSARAFELAILAMLLHDTGYLKTEGDSIGTGAKYTLVHVGRSADFARELLSKHGLPAEEIRMVEHMIRCTGLNADIEAIPFQSELEKRLGFALATADLVGQMAAGDYVNRLDFLYYEFEESNQQHGKGSGAEVYESAADLRRKTPSFWKNYVVPRINQEFQGLHQYLARPPGSGTNDYLQKVERNMELLRNA